MTRDNDSKVVTVAMPRSRREGVRGDTVQLSSLPPLSLYVHIPWCIRKCPYCDFNSHEWRGETQSASGPHVLPTQERYLGALMADLEAALPSIWGRTVHSVFLGGGTPSLFSPDAIHRLLSDLRAQLRLAADCEVTLEANPGTYEKERFGAFRQAGVTRLSVGVQSFNDQHLEVLGRVHSRSQALAALDEANKHFETFNIDLMYALPGQSLADCQHDLDQALALQPPHLSIYHLTIEPNTYFAKFPPKSLPDDDTAYGMLDLIAEKTSGHGMERYEVSAFAKAGHRCRHNLNYWGFGDYLGIGAGAHSKLSFADRVVRQSRVRDPQRYMQSAAAGQAIVQNDQVLVKDLPAEFMMNALRLRDGFALQDFADRTGLSVSHLEPGLLAAERKGWIERDWRWARPTSAGFDFLTDLQLLFLAEP